jgi:CBS domain-containing protein
MSQAFSFNLCLHVQHISAVPMVDGDGRIQGVVSVRDARKLLTRPTRLRFLRQPLEMFEDLHVSPFDHEVS